MIAKKQPIKKVSPDDVLRSEGQAAKEEAEANDTIAQIKYQQLKRDFEVTLAAAAPSYEASFNVLMDMMNAWFTNVQGFDRQNFDGDSMLIVTELAEMVEAHRTSAKLDKIPEFLGTEEELADALVRIFHLAGKYNLRLGAAFTAKMKMNFNRPFKHGKKY